MATHGDSVRMAWLARARGWLLFGCLVGALLPLVLALDRDPRAALPLAGHLSALLVLSGLVGLARAADVAVSRALAILAACVVAARFVFSLVLDVAGDFLSEALGRDIFDVVPYFLSVVSLAAHGLTFASVAAARPRSGAAVGGIAAGGVALALLARVDLEGFGVSELIVVVANGLLTSTLYVALALLVRASVAPGVAPGADLPEALRECGEGLRSFVTWARVRSITIALILFVTLAGALLRSRDASPALPVLFVVVLTGPLLFRAILKLRRAPDGSPMRGPATAALGLAVLHALVDAPWLVFLFYFSRHPSLSSGDREPLAGMVLLTVITASLLDSAVGVVAARFGAATAVPVSGGRIQALGFAAYAIGVCLAGGAVAATADSSHALEEILYVLAGVLLLTALGVRTLAQREMLRASGLR